MRLSELHYAGSHGMDIMGPIRESESVDDHPGCIRTTDEQVELTRHAVCICDPVKYLV